MTTEMSSALVGAIVGSITSLLGSWFMQWWFNRTRGVSETYEVRDAVCLDLDNLKECFEALYAESSDLAGSELSKSLKFFKFIEPVSFAVKYKLKLLYPTSVLEQLDALRFSLRDIREANEEIADSPPPTVPRQHWSNIQAFLGEIAEVRKLLN